MGFYRRIDVRMHGDARFLNLSKPNPNGQTLFERMIHGPFSNSLGLYQVGRMAMAESLGWSIKGFEKAFAEVLAQGMAIYCEEHRLLYLPNFLKHNPPGSTNVAKNWVRLIDSLPECHLVNAWVQQFKAFAEAFPQAFRVPLPEAVATAYRTACRTTPSPSPSPSLYPESNTSPRAEESVIWPSPELLIEKYNRETPDECPAVKSISPGRIRKAKAYLTMFPSEEWWTEVFRQFHRSRYLRGLTNGTKDYPAVARDFDWLLAKGHDQTENAVKVHDGRYSDG